MLGAILYNLIPSAKGSFSLLLEQWWLMPILIISSIILLWRHTTLAYGDIRVKNGWRITLSIILLLITPYFFGVTAGNMAHIQLLLVILLMDRFVSSISVRRSTFFLFDVGFLIGLLSMLHPVYLLFIPYFIIKYHQLDIGSTPHITAQILGTITVWVLYLFIFAEPNTDSIYSALSQKIAPLLSPKLPTLLDLPMLLGLMLFLGSMMILFFSIYRGSISRVRYLYLSHLRFAWFIFLINLIYGSGKILLSASLMLIILFFPATPALYFSASRRTSRQHNMIFFLISLLFAMLAYWRGVQIQIHTIQ